ncbi:GIY-YIG nuclease family protein [Mucilaginibacter sp. RS28]|uniref:GIY-YIG nuclease family protein n=1 Tax=Mucilaginibacter straminoryzae TaxID=2932774 RepID=A0A9X1X7N9_9SPHI|nr:GIY-YIG nuclease family protein [Mucilaginibacter straminoryzae]MCJ8211198.1 GIY-YIG nuclease family protein [Mucilaginibacter straminoryzae]
MPFYTYILQSQKNGHFYVGHTANLDERLNRHNNGFVKATKGKGPWMIVYTEEYSTKLEANQREIYIKSMKSRIFIKKLIDTSRFTSG